MHMRIIKRDLNYYAKILFFFSITLLVYGIILDISENKKYFDPVKDFTVINGDGNTISVTTKDESNTISVNSDSFLDGENELGDSNVNIKTHEYDNSISIDGLNEIFRKEIQEEFGVAIRYGLETQGYSIKTTSGQITTTYIVDSSEINKQLRCLKSVLSLYPKGMFQEIKKGGIPLTILLINNYSDDSITGITDSSYTYANISIAAIHPFEESFFHESYHYIERYLMKKGATFNSWDSFNPEGFSWGNIYNDYSFTNAFLDNSFFVNNYAQTSGAEDRASTFEYMMADTKAGCLNYGTTIWKKADYMSRTIDYVFDTVSPNVVERWERFLY